MKSGNSLCGQPREKNNPVQGKGHKGLHAPPCKRLKKIWFASLIPVTLFETFSEFPSFFEEIVSDAPVAAAGAGTV